MQEVNFTEMARFQPKQIEAWNTLFDNQCKYLLYGGAAGGGKSYFLRWAAIGLGLYYAEKYKIQYAPIGLFSEDYPTLRDRQIIKFKQEIPDWLGEIKEFRDEGYAFLSRPEYGSFLIMLRNLDDPSKYASTEFIAEFVEELTKNVRETFDALKFRLRFPEISEVKFIAATNPGEIGHAWVKKLWIEPDPTNLDLEQDRYKFVPATVYDNKYQTNEYITQLKSMPEQKRKAWLEGSWDVFEGQVFSEWNRNIHIVEPFALDQSWKRYIAMDWGVNKPFSVGWYAQASGRTYLYRELYMNGDEFEAKFGKALTPRRLARVILGLTKDAHETYEYCVADPSLWNKTIIEGSSDEPEGESIAELMIKQGLKLIRGDNDRLNGMGRFREALTIAPDGKPWYQMFRTCYDSIRTIPALVYDKHRVEDVDTDGEDHCYDRDRYFFMSRPSQLPKTRPEQKTRIQSYYETQLKRYENEQEAGDLQW